MSLFPIAGAASRGTQRRPSQPAAPPDDRSLIRRAGDAALGGIAVAGNILDVPGSMARDTIAGLATGNWNRYNPFDQLLSPHTSENRATGRDLNRMAGLAGPQDTWGNFAGGIATEILTDPTSFMHFGSAAASRGGQAAAKVNMLDDVMQIASRKYNVSQNSTLAQQGRKALKGAEIIRGNKIGPRQAQMMVTPNDLMQAASPAKRQALEDATKKMGVNISEQGSKPLGGLVGIAPAPFMDPQWTFGTGPRAQKVAAFLDEWSPNPLNPGRRIMDFEIPGTGKAPIRAAYNLLDRTLKEATTPFTRELARGLTKSQDEARAQARGAVAGFANRLVKLGKATDQEADELRQLFEVPEVRAQASPELRQFADDVENELTDLLQQSQARGIKLELLDDEWIKYFPRFFADSFTGKKGGQSVFSTFTESALKREDFLRNIQGGTVRIKQILQDADLNEAIDGGKSLPFISNLLRQKYGAEVPEDSIKKFASWMRELAPEQRAAGGFANHPLVDLQARLMSGRDSIAAADKVYEALLEPGVLKSTVEPGGIKVGEIFSENRFNVENAKEILASKLNEQAGRDIFTKRSFDHMYVDKPTAQWLKSFIDGFSNPKPASEILEVFDSVQNGWKWAMIGPWPARYTRDFTSGQMNNVFAGTFSWKSLWDGTRAMFGYDIKGAKDIPVVQRLAQQRGYDIDVNDIPFPTGGERDRVFQQAQQVFGDDAEHAVALMEANAKLWARETGQSADEWFKRIRDIRRGNPADLGPNALEQPAVDTLENARQVAHSRSPSSESLELVANNGDHSIWKDPELGDEIIIDHATGQQAISVDHLKELQESAAQTPAAPAGFAQFRGLPQATLKQLAQQQEQFVKSLPDATVKAISNYKSGSSTVSRMMRGGKDFSAARYAQVQLLQEAMREAPGLPRPAVVYRELPSAPGEAADSLSSAVIENVQPGQVLTVNSPLSTSANATYPRWNNGRFAAAEIALPAGTKGLAVDLGGTRLSHEGEFLLPIGSRLKLNAIDTLPSGKKLYRFELVEQDLPKLKDVADVNPGEVLGRMEVVTVQDAAGTSRGVPAMQPGEEVVRAGNTLVTLRRPDQGTTPLFQGEYTVPFGRRGASSEAADKLNAAEQMAAKGTSADDIKRETGWYKGQDGVWRNDVVSGDTVLLIGAESPIGSELGKKTALLREVMDAPWLFSNYPELADYKVRVAAKNFRSRADIDVHNKVIRIHPDESGEKLRDTLIHEATHHIQATEGFGRDYVSSRGASQHTGGASGKIAALKKKRDEIHTVPKGYSASGRYVNYSVEDDGGLTEEAARRWHDIDSQIEEIQRQQRYVRKLVEQKSYWESQSEIEARMAENSQINTESVLKKYDDAIAKASEELQKNLDTADKLLYQSRGDSGPRGAVQFEQDGRAVITAFQAADISTLVHETGHIFRRTLGEIDQKLLSEAEAALGVTGGNWTREAEEAFASGFERYVRDGQAPTSALKRAFERLKTWLMDIYRSIVGTPLEQSVSPELKQVFDDMLGGGRNARPVLDDKAATEIIGELAYAYSVIGKYDGEAQSVIGQAPESLGTSVNDIYSEMLGGGRQQANLLRTGQKLVAWPGSGTTYNPLKARLRGVFGSEKSTLGVAAAGEDVGHLVEGMNRLPPFIKQLREGVDPAVAAAKVGGAQVQYAKRYYTKFQQDVLARVFPFAKYTMGMTPWVLRQLSENPGGAMGATVKAANRAHNPDELTPDYVADTAAIPVQGTPLEALLGQPGEPGTNRYLTGFGLSFEDPLSFIGSTGVRGAMGEAISRMSPPIKAIPEWASGESFFQRGPMGGRDLDDMDPLVGRLISNVKQAATGQEHKFPVRLPDWFEYMAANSPASRALSTARTIADPRKSAAGKAVNLLTGFRITDVSPASQTALIADRAETLMRQMGARQFSRTYFPDDVRKGMTPEELAVAMQLEALQKFVDKARKERNKQSAKN